MGIPISREKREQNIEAYLKQVDAARAKWFARLDSGEIELDPEMHRLYKLTEKQYKQKRESGEFAAMFEQRYYRGMHFTPDYPTSCGWPVRLPRRCWSISE